MLSEERIIHIVHKILDGLEKGGFATYPSREKTTHEAKRVCLSFLDQTQAVEESARQRIASQKNPPPEHSSQWETLYQKYMQEEMKRRGY